jgi:PIN domain nuclease of toxin-antitoxin system
VILLDTCALIWLAEDAPLAPEAQRLMDRSAARGEMYLSPVSAWEIGTLVRRGRLDLEEPAEAWVARVFSRGDVQVALLTPEIAIRSCFLPGDFHADTADRFIVATAVEMGLKLITRDERMLRYGRQGYASVMAC